VVSRLFSFWMLMVKLLGFFPKVVTVPTIVLSTGGSPPPVQIV
jgi:hypothetical protein